MSKRPSIRAAFVAAALFAVFAAPAAAQSTDATTDPYTVLLRAKIASGGQAWDKLRTQHSQLTINAATMTGKVERWSDMVNGRSFLKYTLGTMSGTIGWDGATSWSQEASGQPRVDDAPAMRQLAINAAFRDQLGFWFADRGRARIEFKERARVDGKSFDVVTLEPEGGRAFELWVSADSGLIERLVEPEGGIVRTETYGDFREVDGIKLPFRVRASRGDPKFDELILIDSIEFNVPLTGINFAQPVVPKADVAPPADKASPGADPARPAPAPGPRARVAPASGKLATTTPREPA